MKCKLREFELVLVKIKKPTPQILSSDLQDNELYFKKNNAAQKLKHALFFFK